MFFRKSLIFALIPSFILAPSLLASSLKGEKIPIKLLSPKKVKKETDEEITEEQTIWVDEYEIPNNSLIGGHEFIAILADGNTETRATSLPVRLRNEWFNLELDYEPGYGGINPQYRFSLRHHRFTE